MSDEELAAAVAAGEQRAFGVIFERYHEPLYRFCAGVLGHPDSAADALQRTTLEAMRELKKGKPPIDVGPWLYRIAHEQAAVLLEGEGTAEAAAAPEGGLAEQLRELPDQQRSALLLRELNGLEYPEVAAALSMSPWAARRAVREARESLEPVESERSAARDAQRVRELQELFVLPPAVAAALEEAGRAAIGAEDDVDRGRHRVLVAFLAVAVAVTSVAALAALGTFESGNAGNTIGNRPGGPTPIQVSPGRIQVSPGGVQVGPGSGRTSPGGTPASPGGTQASQPGGTPGFSPGGTPASPGGILVSPGEGTSAVAGYTTPGERNESVLGGG